MDTADNIKWNNYQLLVLQQLEDHGEVLKNLTKELYSVKENNIILSSNLESIKDKINNDPNLTFVKDQTAKFASSITTIENAFNIFVAENKIWKQQVEDRLAEIEEDTQYSFYDEKGFEKRIQQLEKNKEVQTQISSYSKAQWALYLSIIISILNIISHLAVPFLKN